MPGDTFDEFVEDYFAECDEHLSAIRRHLRNAEARVPRGFRAAELDDIARRLETIRALSRIVELEPAAEVAKALADLFRETADAGSPESKKALDLFLSGLGLLDRSIQSKRGWHPVPDHQAFVAEARRSAPRDREVYTTAVVKSSPPADVPDVGIDQTPTPDRIALVVPPRPRDDAPSEASVLPIELGRIDDLTQIMADMVQLRSRLDVSLRDEGAEVSLEALRATNRALERQLRGLRQNVMRMRRVPVDRLFERIRFVTHDMLRGSGRTVRLHFRGTDTSVDVVLIDRLLDPMLRLVRFAALHGIEDRAVRLARGKPAEGTITLSARSASGRIVLETEDDGAGDDIGNASDRLAARSAVHAVHGAITELGGELSVSSAPWRGTKFTLELPVRDVVTDALLVIVGEQVMAIPLLALREVVRYEPGSVTSMPGGAAMPHRGSALSLLPLHRHFGLTPAAEGHPHVLVVERDARRFGLVVDGIIGIREIVARPVSDPRAAEQGVAGAADVGDGRLALILDTHALVGRVWGASFTTNAGDAGMSAVP